MLRALSLVLCLALCFCLLPSFQAGADNIKSAPAVSAKSAILIDLEENEILFEKNARERLPMASTTKIMTALVVCDIIELDTVVAIPPSAVGVEGSSVYLKAGELMSIKDLLTALLLESANDAAEALAIVCAGSVKEFAKRCNEKAQELGLKNSNFTNPHGLFDENHYTTAYDLAIISAHALKNPQIREIVSTKSAKIPLDVSDENPFGKGVRILKNHNKMLSTYEGAIGMKTGFTKKSGRCLVSAAKRGDLTLIAVTLCAPDDWQDHTAMLDYGFENYEYRTFFEKGAFKYDYPVSNGTAKTVTLTNASPIRALVKKGKTDAKTDIEAHFRFAIAPIKKDQIFATLTVSVENKKLRSSLISSANIATKDEKNGFFESFFD